MPDFLIFLNAPLLSWRDHVAEYVPGSDGVVHAGSSITWWPLRFAPTPTSSPPSQRGRGSSRDPCCRGCNTRDNRAPAGTPRSSTLTSHEHLSTTLPGRRGSSCGDLRATTRLQRGAAKQRRRKNTFRTHASISTYIHAYEYHGKTSVRTRVRTTCITHAYMRTS